MLLDRRAILGAAAACAAGPALTAPASSGPFGLIVAGPTGGRLDRWAAVIAGPVGHALPARTPLTRQNVGGLDGVTGANQFEATSELDGSKAMLVPGTAALSWLVGETRAKFDPARWVPLWAGVTSTVLMSRVALVPGRPLRVAAAGPTGPELPILLALDLMGLDAVLGPRGTADAILVQGPATEQALIAATGPGFQPVLSLGIMGPDGSLLPDPMLPTIPLAIDAVRNKAPASLLGALVAASLAVQLEAGLVLPQLTPAGSVALWRGACAALSNNQDMVAEAVRLGMRQESAATAADCTSRIAGNPEILIALRRWLATRYQWRAA